MHQVEQEDEEWGKIQEKIERKALVDRVLFFYERFPSHTQDTLIGLPNSKLHNLDMSGDSLQFPHRM